MDALGGKDQAVFTVGSGATETPALANPTRWRSSFRPWA